MMAWGQFNIARAKYDLDDPRMAGFFDAVPRMNATAERSPGFIWRLKDEGPACKELFSHEPRMTMTLSKWRSVEDLAHFTWNTIHKRFRLRTQEWFEDMGTAYLVMWEIPDDHLPTSREAWDQLCALRENGPTATRKGTAALMPPI